MYRLAVLLTVHNRKDKTLKCLRALKAQKLPVGCEIDIYLTDDGCTDGTPEAIASEFPEINIVKGDGNLFWNRGMYRAWEAASNAYDYDWYLWLNDDTLLFDNSIEMLLSVAKIKDEAIIVGPTCATDNLQRTTYSGLDKAGHIIVPNDEIQYCQTFNGNIVLVPRIVFQKIGNLDYAYHHALGDLDYGLCVKRFGFENCVAPFHCGICDHNPLHPAWVRPEVPFVKRWKNFYSPLAYGEPKALFHFNKKNYNILKAIKVWGLNHIRVLFPYIWTVIK